MGVETEWSYRPCVLRLVVCGVGVAIAPHLSKPAIAQIVPDDTLGSEASKIVPDETVGDDPASIIEGGAARENSLFHSFEQFNIGENQRVFFANPSDISTIFSRVTGADVSNILGTLGVSGPAALFFLNPNGIVFGPNAAIDISGSLFMSTAESLLFEGGFEFGTNAPQGAPLLTISAPIGLQYGARSGDISVQGPGHNLSLDFSDHGSRIVQDNRPLGLQIHPDQTLALIGGEVTLAGANLTTEGGRLEVGSVGAGSLVGILSEGDLGGDVSKYEASYDTVERFGNIQLTESASAIAAGSGEIQLSGRRILVDSGAIVLATDSASLAVDATEDLSLLGPMMTASQPSPFPTGLLLQNEPGSTVDAGTLRVKTPQLLIDDGAGIIAQNFGAGAGGSIDIQAHQLQVQDGSFLFAGTYDSGAGSHLNIESQQLQIADSLVAAVTLDTGMGGDIDIRADLLQVDDQATVSTDSFAAGSAGNIAIQARQVQLQNGALVSANGRDLGASGSVSIEAKARLQIEGAGVFTETLSPNTGGGIDLLAQEIQITEGAVVSSGTGGTGQGGNINVNADQLQIVDATVSADTLGPGLGGDVSVQTRQLAVERGRISARSLLSSGAGGNITLNAGETITLLDRAEVNTESDVSSTGDSGNITIRTGSLLLEQGSRLLSRSSGFGRAGDVTIQATDAVTLRQPYLSEDGTLEIPTGILALLEFQSVGEGGNIDITSGSLSVLDGSELLANTFGEGDAGNVQIRTRGDVVVDGVRPLSAIPSGIFSNVGPGGVGNAGRVDIQAAALQVTNGARVASSVEGTAAIPGRPAGVGTGGEINIEAGSVLLSGTSAGGDRISGLFTDTQAGAAGDGGRITIRSDTLRVAGGAQINSQTENASDSGNVEIDTSLQLAVGGGSEITVSSRDIGSAGNLLIASPSVVLDDGDITAQTSSGDGGNINLQVDDVLLLRNGSELSSTAGSAGTGGDGGDISIEAGFITAIAQENSDITANAFNGQGGNISVNTQGVLGIENRDQLTFRSDITASSELGQNGVVVINAPQISPNSEEVALPVDVLSLANPIGQSLCSGEGNAFTVSGTGGLPASPYDTLNGAITWEDWYISEETEALEDFSEDSLDSNEAISNATSLERPLADDAIQEAQGWHVDQQGNTVLLLDSELSSAAPSNPVNRASCQQLSDILLDSSNTEIQP